MSIPVIAKDLKVGEVYEVEQPIPATGGSYYKPVPAGLLYLDKPPYQTRVYEATFDKWGYSISSKLVDALLITGRTMKTKKDEKPSDAMICTYVKLDAKLNKLERTKRLQKIFNDNLAAHLWSVAKVGQGRFYIGTDPEIFAIDKNGEVIPAWKFLPAKDNAVSNDYNVKLHWDGFQAEWCTPKETCHGYAVDRLFFGLNGIYSKAKKFDPNALLSCESVMRVSDKELAEASDEHVQLGCSPSINIYEEFVPPVSSGRELPIRFAGFHIHFGSRVVPYNGRYEADFASTYGHEPPLWQDEILKRTVNALDHIAGIASVALFAKMDNPERRRFYGRPGEYRVSKDQIRMEYRTLSSSVLCHPAVSHLVLDLARQAASLGQEGLFSKVWKCSDEKMREIVLHNDVRGALKVINQNKTLYEQLFKKHYTSTAASQGALNVLEKGVKNFIDVSPKALAEHWALGNGDYTKWKIHSENRNAHWNYFGHTCA